VRKLPTNLVCAHLGRVLEIEVNGEVWTWPKRAKVDLLWHEPTKSLIWWDATSKTIAPAKSLETAAEKYEEFQRKNPRRALGRAYQVAGKWECVGPCARIDYHSTKWGDDASYTHKLGKSAKLYRLGSQGFCIQAAKLRLTTRGIEG
jgi:hypothetical protein